MKEIVDRLQENRQIELAKGILESAGYSVVLVESEEKDVLDSISELSRDNNRVQVSLNFSKSKPLVVVIDLTYPRNTLASNRLAHLVGKTRGAVIKSIESIEGISFLPKK